MKAYLYIRFSSKKQKDGNSIARQTEFANTWALKNKIAIEATITDEGVSAFRGKNKTTGALSVFLAACMAGSIPRGSILIVENLDRISREHPLDAMPLMRDIIRTYGIRIVTMHPEYEYNNDNLDMIGYILMVIETARGNSESATKRKRSNDNWKRKRANAANEIVTSRVPNWCQIQDGKIVANQR
jgi:DNA invertase Pin-like site-specific DNA recombinase